MQSRLHSFLESAVSTIVGMMFGLMTQLVVFPLYGIHVQLHQNIQIVVIFTCVSFIYRYIIRRAFNRRHHSVVQLKEVKN